MRFRLLGWVLGALLVSGCVVGKKTHEALQTDLAKEKAMCADRIATLEDQLTGTQADLGEETTRCDGLASDLAAANGRVKKLMEELKDKAALEATVADMQQALAELDRRRAQADARVAAYQDLIQRFRKLIDAGKLKVKIVDGRMVVELATDVLFASGSAALSEEGREAVVEVAKVLAEIPGRRYQVEGHTDDVPIGTQQFPSNWELASARALTVVRAMTDAGLGPRRISAASFGEFRPIAPNDTKENKAVNRRIEIVVVPDLSDLPGFEELASAGK